MPIDIDSISIVGPVTGIETRASQADASAFEIFQNNRVAHDWNNVIDQKLIEWGNNPAELADVDRAPPTPKCLTTAFALARNARTLALTAPTKVLPTGDGGIGFEWRDGEKSTCIEIDATGKAEILLFVAARLKFRSVL